MIRCCVWSRNLKNEDEAMARFGLQGHSKKRKVSVYYPVWLKFVVSDLQFMLFVISVIKGGRKGRAFVMDVDKITFGFLPWNPNKILKTKRIFVNSDLRHGWHHLNLVHAVLPVGFLRNLATHLSTSDHTLFWLFWHCWSCFWRV
jgi:hypothetical protein